MKSHVYRLALAMLCAGGLLANGQAALKSAKVSDYKGDVTLSQGGGSAKPVQVNATVTPSDVVRTGAKSLAELQFNDNTLTRLGANTIFSYSPKNREFQVESGTALLQVPPGLGGAKIQTAAVTAAITGTTVMVQKLPSGVVKLMVLEGSMNATLKGNNQMRTIKAGQMLIVPPNISTLPQPIVINVATVMGTSKLVKGFNTELSSEDQIEDTVEKQKELAGNGGLKTGGVVITTTEDLLSLIGNNVLDSATFDSLTQQIVDDNSHGSGGNHYSGGAITVTSGAVVTPTTGGTLGFLTLANGMVIPAVDSGYPDETLITLSGPVTFTGTLPTVAVPSQGGLALMVQDYSLSATTPGMTFQGSTNNQGPNDFDYVSFITTSGAIVFNGARFDVGDTVFNAVTGNIDVQGNTALDIEDGFSYFYAGNNLKVDGSSIDIIGTGSGVELSSNSGMQISGSTVGGDAVSGAYVGLVSYGNININNSYIGGTSISDVMVYAHGGANLNIVNSTIRGSQVSLHGAVLSIAGTSITASSINFYTNSFVDGGGNSFSVLPNIQPYAP